MPKDYKRGYENYQAKPGQAKRRPSPKKVRREGVVVGKADAYVDDDPMNNSQGNPRMKKPAGNRARKVGKK